MKQNILSWYALGIFVCLLVCGGCSNEDVYYGDGATSLSSEQKENVLNAIVEDGGIDFFPSTNPKFSQLQQDELMYAFHLIAQQIVDGDFMADEGITKQEYYDYYFALLQSFHDLAQEHYNKPYNHLTGDEFANLFDNENRELIKRGKEICQNNSRTKAV